MRLAVVRAQRASSGSPSVGWPVAFVGYAAGHGRAGQRVGIALADQRGPGQAADDVTEQGADVVLRARGRQAELGRRDGGDGGLGLGNGPAVQRAGVHVLCHGASLGHKLDN